jgi:hypothetical protein
MRRAVVFVTLVLGLTLLASPPASAAVAAEIENRTSGSPSGSNNLVGIEPRLSEEAVREKVALAYELASDDAVAARGLPNSALVARGGNAANQSAARINAAIGPSRTPGVSGFSAQCNGGTCLSELGKFIPNKQLGVTTVGEIRAIGGDVIATPGFGNHVTVTGVTGEAVSPLFRIVPNPNPLVVP